MLQISAITKCCSGKSKLKSLYLRGERSSFVFFFPMVCQRNTQKCSEQVATMFSTAENGETKGHVCHVTNDVNKGTDQTTETIMKSNAENRKLSVTA